MTKIEEILKHFNIVPNNPELFIQAFSHSSYVNEKRSKLKDYERIEFIGDAVLDLIVADLIYSCHSELDQGEMSKLRSKLVQSASLANYARHYHFGEAIFLGHGEKLSGGADNGKILEDVFEAFLGATYLDQGFDFVYQIIKGMFIEDIEHFEYNELTDYKSRLQEEIQSDRRGNVVYQLISEKGNAQDKEFVVEVIYNDIILGVGSGSSKKKAEQDAARDALTKRAR